MKNMKTLKLLTLLFTPMLLSNSLYSDDDSATSSNLPPAPSSQSIKNNTGYIEQELQKKGGVDLSKEFDQNTLKQMEEKLEINYKIKNIYKTTKISSYYYKEKTVQNNKSMLMLSSNKQGINNNIHDKKIVLLKNRYI